MDENGLNFYKVKNSHGRSWEKDGYCLVVEDLFHAFLYPEKDGIYMQDKSRGGKGKGCSRRRCIAMSPKLSPSIELSLTPSSYHVLFFFHIKASVKSFLDRWGDNFLWDVRITKLFSDQAVKRLKTSEVER